MFLEMEIPHGVALYRWILGAKITLHGMTGKIEQSHQEFLHNNLFGRPLMTNLRHPRIYESLRMSARSNHVMTMSYITQRGLIDSIHV